MIFNFVIALGALYVMLKIRDPSPTTTEADRDILHGVRAKLDQAGTERTLNREKPRNRPIDIERVDPRALGIIQNPSYQEKWTELKRQQLFEKEHAMTDVAYRSSGTFVNPRIPQKMLT